MERGQRLSGRCCKEGRVPPAHRGPLFGVAKRERSAAAPWGGATVNFSISMRSAQGGTVPRGVFGRVRPGNASRQAATWKQQVPIGQPGNGREQHPPPFRAHGPLDAKVLFATHQKFPFDAHPPGVGARRFLGRHKSWLNRLEVVGANGRHAGR